MECLRKTLLLFGAQRAFRNRIHLLDDEQAATAEVPEASKGQGLTYQLLWTTSNEYPSGSKTSAA